MKVLIVEDEIRLAQVLNQFMKDEKYLTDVVNNGEDAISYVLNQQYDVVILDVMLPKLSGFEVVRRMREAKNATPVILLTAKDDISDKVKGLDSGADDYLTKPFSPEELLARVRALSRRQGDVVLDELIFYNLTLNLSTNMLYTSTKSVHLSFKESEVIKILMANSKIVTSKEDLISKVWGQESDVEENNVEAYISFLRKKIFYLDSKIEIKTIRKVGYQLEVRQND